MSPNAQNNNRQKHANKWSPNSSFSLIVNSLHSSKNTDLKNSFDKEQI